MPQLSEGNLGICCRERAWILCYDFFTETLPIFKSIKANLFENIEIFGNAAIDFD